MKNIVIQLANVNKRFGALHAVRNVSFEIQRGQVCGFLGPNGAGKSTTIRMIMSILLPDSGVISVLGGSALDAKDRIGYLPEERGLYRKMRVADFLRFMAKLKGISRADADARIRSWLERVELPNVSQKRCEELSKGMQQKLQFIASVLHEPPLLILDEPFSGLDPVNRRLLSSVVRQLKENGTTILFSTHQMEQAEDLCDQVLLVHKGEKVLDETMNQIHGRFDPRTILAEPAFAVAHFLLIQDRRVRHGACSLARAPLFLLCARNFLWPAPRARGSRPHAVIFPEWLCGADWLRLARAIQSKDHPCWA